MNNEYDDRPRSPQGRTVLFPNVDGRNRETVQTCDWGTDNAGGRWNCELSGGESVIIREDGRVYNDRGEEIGVLK